MQESNVQVQSRPRHAGSILEAPRLNLPVPPTALIGRERELALAQQILSDPRSRLLTLTGPGGVGKTRLSLEIAHHLADSFDDGVAFVSLAPVNDPTLVVASIAAALGLREDSSSSLIERLKNALRDRHRLLVLDNFEQVIAAAPLVVELLSAAPQVRVIVSSRAPLRVRGERELPLAPLGLPGSQQDGAIADSVSLFVQAASAVDPGFRLSQENQATIAEICIRLDGLPLAIELAAARVRLLPPAKLLARLEHRLSFLTGGARDLPARQQTLRDAIAWSHDLLEPSERRVFRRLAAFTGGCTLEAAERVCHGEGEAEVEMLEVIGSLVEKSMLVRQLDHQGEWRVGMLETIREFAVQMLAASGEEEEIRLRHANYFIALAEKGMIGLMGREQKDWLRIYEENHDNFRAALRWLLDTGRTAPALTLAAAMGRFWLMRTYLSEGRDWLKRTIDAAGDDASQDTLARTLNHHGNILLALGELLQAQSSYERGREIYRSMGKMPQVVVITNNLGNIAVAMGDVTRAREIYEQSLEIKRSLSDDEGITVVLTNLGNILHLCGEYDRARELYEEALETARAMGNKQSELFSLSNLGILYHSLGDIERSGSLYEEALVLARELSDRRAEAIIVNHIGKIYYDLEDLPHARTLHTEALALFQEMGDRTGMTLARVYLGTIAASMGDPLEGYELLKTALASMAELRDRIGMPAGLEEVARLLARPRHAPAAATLMGAAHRLRKATGAVMGADVKPRHNALLDALRSSLDEAAFNQAWERGEGMSLEQTLELALNIDPAWITLVPAEDRTEPAASPAPAVTHPASPAPSAQNSGIAVTLTSRELGVLQLVAADLTDAEIAGQLHISIRTVNAHLRSIYGKLGVSSRKDAARTAANLGIVRQSDRS